MTNVTQASDSHTSAPRKVTSVDEASPIGTLLGVWAHPDDEAYLSAGLMAFAAKNGNNVVCITATRGEHGTPDPTRFPPAVLATIRAREMAAALTAVGVEDQRWLGLRRRNPRKSADRSWHLRCPVTHRARSTRHNRHVRSRWHDRSPRSLCYLALDDGGMDPNWLPGAAPLRNHHRRIRTRESRSARAATCVWRWFAASDPGHRYCAHRRTRPMGTRPQTRIASRSRQPNNPTDRDVWHRALQRMVEERNVPRRELAPGGDAAIAKN